MPMRRKTFVAPYIYHLFNRSISHFRIFDANSDKTRFLQILDHYNNTDRRGMPLSRAIKSKEYEYHNIILPRPNIIVKILAYCIMPTHYHLLVKAVHANQLPRYISNIENAYTRFFNKKHSRKGPLWESRFKAVIIEGNEQLLHVHRYIHLNPSTSNLVNNPEDWPFSSYRDFIKDDSLYKLLKEISINNSRKYRAFVENQKDYQKTLRLIKKKLID